MIANISETAGTIGILSGILALIHVAERVLTGLYQTGVIQ